MKKLNITELVPANDILQDEMEAVKGGWEVHLCFSGCKTGEKGDKGTSEPSKPTTSPGTESGTLNPGA